MIVNITAQIEPVKNLSGTLSNAVRVDDAACDKAREEGFRSGSEYAAAAAEAANAVILADCNAVLPTKGVETAETLEQVPQRIGEIQSYADGYDVGLKDGEKAFWGRYLYNGNRTNYMYAFANWPIEAIKPMYDVRPTNAHTIFGNVAGTLDLPVIEKECGITFDFSRCTNFTNPFTWSNLVNAGFVDTTAASDLATLFAYATELHTASIKLKEDGSQRVVQSFIACNSLENLTITSGLIGKDASFSYCSKLSAESVQNIIDHLADLTGATAQTLTFHATVGAKLTDAQKATITAKNWTLVY